MASCSEQAPMYQSLYSSTPDNTVVTIIVLATVVPLQMLCLVGFCLYSRQKKKFTIMPQVGSTGEDAGEDRVKMRGKSMDVSKKQAHVMHLGDHTHHKIQPQPNKCTKLLLQFQQYLGGHTSKNKLIALCVIIMLFLVAGLVMLIVTVIASQQALSRQFSQAECVLSNRLGSFVEGDGDWIGLSHMVSNLTKLQLNLNTRVRVTKNSINSLQLNGTNTTFFIGFPNSTIIFTPVTNTNVVANTVQKFIDAGLRQYLIKNGSLSSTYRFPICQTSTISNIPHPLNDGQTIELNYMSSICGNLTNEVNSLVANGRAVDQLLVQVNSVESSRPSTNANLSLYNNTLTGVSLRSSQYSTQFNGTNIDVTGQRAIGFIMLGVNGVLLIMAGVYFGCQIYRLNKYMKKQEEQENDELDPQLEHLRKSKRKQVRKNTSKIPISLQNISVSAASELPPSQIRRKQQEKIKQIMKHGLFGNSVSTHTFNIVFLLIVMAIGFSAISYSNSVNLSRSYCDIFGSILGGQSLADVGQLSSSQVELLTPIQNCLTNKLATSLGSANSGDHFLETTETPTYLTNIQQLYKISALYNSSTPTNVLTSTSLQQIQILKSYLLHMETMPIKSPDFTIQSILTQLNTYTNGSSISSRQRNQCSQSLLRDQYVYNAVDCENTLINYLTETLITEPRCLQIPTWQGSGGTKDADLNDAQHTIELNGTCPTIYDFYNGSNAACFLGKRLDILRTANCTTTAQEYNRRLKNLIKFSVQTASYTNSYLQNLRNYFGAYVALSTNLSQFFNGPNTSSLLNQFGSLSNNLINKTSCSYIRNSMNTIYTTYCPGNSSIGMLLHDCYIFVFVAFGVGAIAWGLAVAWEIGVMAFARGFFVKGQEERYWSEIAGVESSARPQNQKNVIKLKEQKKGTTVNKNSAKHIARPYPNLQISEQTLRQEDHLQQNNMERLKRLDIIEYQSPNEPQDGPEQSQNQQPRSIEYQQIEQNKKDSDPSENYQQDKTQQNNGKNIFDQDSYEGQKLGNQETNKKKNRQPQEKQQEASIKYEYVDGYRFQLRKEQKLQPNQDQQAIQQEDEDTISVAQQKNSHKFDLPQKEKQKTQKKPLRVYQISSSQQSQLKPKAPLFFGNNLDPSGPLKYEQDSRIDDFASKESYRAERKAQSKAEMRHQPERTKKSPRSIIMKVSKQGRENQRLKVVQLDNILKQTIDMVSETEKNKK